MVKNLIVNRIKHLRKDIKAVKRDFYIVEDFHLMESLEELSLYVFDNFNVRMDEHHSLLNTSNQEEREYVHLVKVLRKFTSSKHYIGMDGRLRLELPLEAIEAILDLGKMNISLEQALEIQEIINKFYALAINQKVNVFDRLLNSKNHEQ